MTIDWTISIATIVSGITTVAMLVSLYFGLKTAITAQGANLTLSMTNLRSEFTLVNITTKDDVLKQVSKVDSEVRDLSHRVSKLESGQDEWTKTLRERTHELGNQVQALIMKVDRLERPQAGPERHR